MKPIINKKASFNYFFLEKLEAGLTLSGNEIKAVRAGNISLDDSFVAVRDGEATLVNAYIAPYEKGGDQQTDSRRSRKLLLHKKEIDYLLGKLSGANLTVVPTKLYFERNYAKLEIALARGKKQYDKRATIKKREQEREAQATLREAKLKAQKEAP